MNIQKTIENIYKNCENYVMPSALATVIDENYYLGPNIAEDEKNSQKFTREILELHKNENIFLKLALVNVVPFIRECDIYSTEDCTVKLDENEFDRYKYLKERYFGILLLKNSSDYILGTCDVCGCKVDSSFIPLDDNSDNLIKKLKEIVDEKIIS